MSVEERTVPLAFSCLNGRPVRRGMTTYLYCELMHKRCPYFCFFRDDDRYVELSIEACDMALEYWAREPKKKKKDIISMSIYIYYIVNV